MQAAEKSKTRASEHDEMKMRQPQNGCHEHEYWFLQPPAPDRSTRRLKKDR